LSATLAYDPAGRLYELAASATTRFYMMARRRSPNMTEAEHCSGNMLSLPKTRFCNIHGAARRGEELI